MQTEKDRLIANEVKEKMGKWVLIAVNPFIGRERKYKALSNVLDTLTEKAFENLAENVIKTLGKNWSKKASRKYKSAEEEVDYVLNLVPRLKSYRVYFLNLARNKRKELGLPI